MTTLAQSPLAREGTPPSPTAAQAGYTLSLLFVANLLNYADRSLLGIVVEPVSRELVLSDTQISIVSGLAFVVFNLLVGVFISRWVDRGDRRLILTAGVVVWTVATWATGYAGGFLSLAACRALVGMGEATVFPVALSLLADYYGSAKMPRSAAIFQASSGVGVVVGSILAGVLAAAFGWRTMFAVCGAGGLLLALAVFFTLKEPVRGQQDSGPALAAPAGLLASLKTLLLMPGFIWLSLGFAASGMTLAVLPTWAPTFLLRSHGLDVAKVGAAIGPAAGLGGILGTILAGMIATSLVRRTGSRRAALLVPIIALPAAAPAFATFLFSPSLAVALVGVAITNFALSSSLGPCVALGVGMAPPSMRGLASTLILIVQGILCAALAPFAVGVASDALAGAYGSESLRYALSMLIAAPLLATFCLWVARRRISDAAAPI